MPRFFCWPSAATMRWIAASSIEFWMLVSDDEPTFTTIRWALGICDGLVIGETRFFPRFSELICSTDFSASPPMRSMSFLCKTFAMLVRVLPVPRCGAGLKRSGGSCVSLGCCCRAALRQGRAQSSVVSWPWLPPC